MERPSNALDLASKIVEFVEAQTDELGLIYSSLSIAASAIRADQQSLRLAEALAREEASCDSEK